MMAFSKCNAVEKDALCTNIYNQFIAETSDFISSCEDIAKPLNAHLPSGCYTNFRDALFHFRRMFRSTEENEIWHQAFAIEEHANRAKTDAIVCLLEYCTFLLQILSHEDFNLSYAALERLTIIKKDIDNCVLLLRLNGIMLNQSGLLRISDSEFEELIDRFLDFINTFVGEEKYHTAIQQLTK